MSPEKQREVIAEACGWEFIQTWEDYSGIKVLMGNYGDARGRVPDYLEDLNSCAHMEAAILLTPEAEAAYSMKLQELTHEEDDGFAIYPERSPARRRCKAILMITGKWEKGGTSE